MSSMNINVHNVISVKEETNVHDTFTVTNLYIKTANGETSTVSLFNDIGIRPDHFTWSKT
jgi:hypothetical protein